MKNNLQFIFGSSGSGKSDYLCKTVLAQAHEEPDKNFLVIVPEQYTMQTQREYVSQQKDHAIMNVDVLSFNRLAYRVFAELGLDDLVVLEETGKNLIMRKVAQMNADNLPVLGGNMNRMGYVDEVKSLISEMVQYNISPDTLERYVNDGSLGETLCMKLGDVLTLYRGYEEYMKGRYITSEEILSLLCEVAPQSGMIRNAVLIFDEFTGFTPIQNRLLRVLFALADSVMVSVSIDIREQFYSCRGTHELFYMSKNTILSLMHIADDVHMEVADPITLSPGSDKRYKNAPDLFFLEENIFRPDHARWTEETEHIGIYALKDPREEVIFVAQRIAKLVRSGNYRYRDIALVTGAVDTYANYVPEIFAQYDIPYFIDQTRNILFSPLTEFVRATLEVVERDFTYESVFRFLRCGLFDADINDIDRLENYVLARGIRGRRRWERPWTFVLPDGTKGDEPHLNELKNRIVESFKPLVDVFTGKHTVAEQTYALYSFIVSLSVEEKIKAREAECEACGEPAKAKEYSQIYKIVMDILDKTVSLLGDDVIPINEYSDILDAGFSAAKVGVIPPGNDCVMVGDIERTRLNHIRILFFAGVNDGIVPNNSGGGGIISQFERERLAEHDMTLAPGMRERVFIQKFYLYISMTKPSDGLYISYSKTSADGKALRPSYLISVVNSMYEKLEVKEVVPDDIITPENGLDLLLSGFRGAHSDEWNTLASWYLGNDDYRKRFMRLLDAAYHRHTDEPIGRAVTRALYGTELYNSVTRLEHFASCAFAHYLSYGLRLRERELYQFASVDMGNIYHDALCNFSNKVQNSEYTWHSIPEDIERQWVEESMEEAILADENAGVFEEARNIYLLGRMKDTMRKTVWALIKQIKKGNFTPSGFEVSFGRAKDLKAIEFGLGDGEKMRLNGRIDRVDTYETDDKVYVRIIDYKSGNTTFSLVNLYYGLQLQLVVYMNAAVELTRQSHPGKAVEPAGLFYYHIKDPIVDVIGGESETQIEEAVFKELKLNGLVSDNPGVYRAMDAEFSGTSDVIPVGEKNDGSLKAASSVASAEDFATIAGYVNEVIADAGRQIMAGNIAMEPYMMGDRTGCDYCPYHTVCGFDARMDGYAYRKLASSQDPEELMALMRHEVGSDDGIANDEA